MSKAKRFKQSTGLHMSKPLPLEPKQHICSLCGLVGGTMERDNGGYRHQDRRFCEGAKRLEDRRKASEYVEKLKAKEKENATD